MPATHQLFPLVRIPLLQRKKCSEIDIKVRKQQILRQLGDTSSHIQPLTFVMTSLSDNSEP